MGTWGDGIYDNDGALDEVVFGPQVGGVSEGRFPDGAAWK